MREPLTHQMTMNGTVEDVRAILLDFEGYPRWRSSITTAEVLETGSAAVTRVRFGAHVGPWLSHYTVEYTEEAHELTWSLVHGDLLAAYDGRWSLQPSAHRQSLITYSLRVTPSMPAPGFIVREATRQDLLTTLRELGNQLA